MKNIIALSILCTPLIPQAAECSVDYFRQIEKDTQKTTLQKKNALDKVCIDTIRTATGVVVDVRSTTEITVKAADGFEYVFHLQANHNCGDAINISKGQKIAAKGKVIGLYDSILTLRLKDSVCLK